MRSTHTTHAAARPPEPKDAVSADLLVAMKAVAASAVSRMTFTATKRVEGEAPDADRRLCMPGDTITVFRWLCHRGPTVLRVESSQLGVRRRCLPFEWVMEMGAPGDLDLYMPPAPHTWEDALKACSQPSAPA